MGRVVAHPPGAFRDGVHRAGPPPRCGARVDMSWADEGEAGEDRGLARDGRRSGRRQHALKPSSYTAG